MEFPPNNFQAAQQEPAFMQVPQTPTDHEHRTRMILVGIVVVVFLGAIGFFVWFVQRGGDERMDTQTAQQPSQDQPPVQQEPVVDPFPGDRDRDGIEDEKEKELGTSTRDFDTDGDGLSDQAEIETWKSDPLKYDTDGDGYADGIEVINGYNPAGEGKLQMPQIEDDMEGELVEQEENIVSTSTETQ